jgi:hypothetical protein
MLRNVLSSRGGRSPVPRTSRRLAAQRRRCLSVPWLQSRDTSSGAPRPRGNTGSKAYEVEKIYERYANNIDKDASRYLVARSRGERNGP